MSSWRDFALRDAWRKAAGWDFGPERIFAELFWFRAN
jgi:hypothetical protein